MRHLGPTWALILTLDSHLLTAITLANLGFAISAVLLVFRDRPILDRVLIGAGVFLLVMGASLAALHLLAAAPIREVQLLVFD